MVKISQEWLQVCHKLYQNLHMHVTTHIIEAYLIHRELTGIHDARETKERAAHDQTKEFEPLRYCMSAAYQQLSAASTMKCRPEYIKKNPNWRHYEKYLEELKIQIPAEGERIVTWLELYTLYRIQGHAKPIPDPDNKAEKRATLDKQIRQFKKQVRRHVKDTLDNDSAQLFAPGKASQDSLIGIGLMGKHEGPSFNIYISNDIKHQIAEKLVLLGHTIGQTKASDFLKGNKRLEPVKLNTKGKVGWDSAFPATRLQNNPTTWETDYADKDVEIPPETTFFLCPKCKICKASATGGFNRYKLDINIKCKMCSKSTTCALWKCKCGDVWYRCPRHSAYQSPGDKATKHKAHHIDTTIQDSIIDNNPANKKPRLGCPDPHDLLVQDMQRAEAKRSLPSQSMMGDIVLGDAMHDQKRLKKLGPILSKRFC